MSLPGLADDEVVFSQAVGTSDAEGNATGTLSTVLTTRCTWGTPTSRELELADQRGQQVDAVLGMETPSVEIKPGHIADVRGERWVVVQARPSQIHQRVFLRRSE